MSSFSEIKTLEDLAVFLKVKLKMLTYLLYYESIDKLYHSFEIPKKNGNFRQINAPDDVLRGIQKKLADALCKHQKANMRRQDRKQNVSHAFEKEKSFITNAKIHRNKRFVLNFDLEDFFDSFHFGRVRGYFEKNNNFKLPDKIATVIAQLTCYKGCLPQGAPSSPIITNLICNVFDMRVLKLSKQFKLDYTRYADDLTFSTNNKEMIEAYDRFVKALSREVERSGFKINEKKTRFAYRDSRQAVTGLTVNKKINVDRKYYKETRAMAHSLYSKNAILIDGKEASIDQLEGRFSFINQIEKYNNKINNKNYNNTTFSAKEEDYRKLLYYKYFCVNKQPVIITEGKTDIVYIKAAMKNLYSDFPELITKTDNDDFNFNVSFINKTKRLKYFFKLHRDGASPMKNIYNCYVGKDSPNYTEYFKKFDTLHDIIRKNPVILIIDNELSGRETQLKNFMQHIKMNDRDKIVFSEKQYARIIENLYVLTTPLPNGEKESEIEDLFDSETLAHEIDGRKFSKKGEEGFYGKNDFSKYIAGNYKKINFDGFKPFLENLKEIIKMHNTD